MLCEVCQQPARDVWVCSGCYQSGHPSCFGMEVLDGYAFCQQCMPWAIQQHSRITTEQQKSRWARRLSGQLANWKEMSITAAGTLGAVGMAIGGAGAMVVGGTTALVRGAFEGAMTGSTTPRLQIEDEGPVQNAQALSWSGVSDACCPPASGCHGIAAAGES